jgi:D-xylose transport system ATP-binding protein
MHPVVAARGLTKRFPGVVALRGVDFDLRAGEIHALCGENGAGKSTLIKLLSGIHPHGSYEGELRIDGRPAAFRSVRDAEAAGLAVITQELALVDGLSVAENLFLGRAPRRGWRIDWPTLHRRAADLLREFGLDVDPETPVGRLGIGQKQLVEIARAMDKRSRVLVLDEPTAALAAREVGVLQEHLRRLRAGGTACIYISHRLEEVRALADRVTVLRDGATVATLERAEAEPAVIIRQMVGRELTEPFPRPAAAVERRGEPLLVVAGLRVAPPGGSRIRLEDVSLSVHPGEVLGIGGLMGAGRTELLLHLFAGWGRRLAGEVTLRGRPYAEPAPDRSIARGLVLATEDRRRLGLIPGEGIAFNLSLASLGRFTRRGGRLDRLAEEQAAAGLFQSLRIRAPGLNTPVRGLSGGNQQKVVLGKALLTAPAVVFLDEPTRGIDVGARVEVYHLIQRLTAAGCGVVLVSSDLPELMGLSDRIVMLAAGRPGGEFARATFDPERLLAAALQAAPSIPHPLPG